MDDKKWKHAAWMAIGAAALTPANLLLSVLADLPMGAPARVGLLGGVSSLEVVFAIAALLVATLAAALSLIALYRFRELLNERYDYHGIDGLVTFVIITITALTLVSVVGRVFMAVAGVGNPPIALARGGVVLVALLFVVPIMLLGVATGIAGIIVGVKLFSLDVDLQHLLRPYAVISIVGGACFALVVLAPVGMLLLIAENVVLALLFLRAGETEPTVDFV